MVIIPNPLPRTPKSFIDAEVANICRNFRIKQDTAHLYKGRLCFLFDKNNNKYINEITEEGFIAAVGIDHELAPSNTRQPFIVSIFVKDNDDFLYIGDVASIALHQDKKRNILLWG
jgi:hypothetical protein